MAADYKSLAALVRKAKAGDGDAFTALYQQTYQNTYFLAQSILRDEQDAQDAVQDAYIQIFRNLANLRDETLFIAWANRITYNACMHILSRQLPTTEDEELQFLVGEGADENDPMQGALMGERNEILMGYIDRLPATLKATLILRYYDDLKLHEIASVMGCPEGTIKSRLNTAKKLLKNAIANHKGESVFLGGFGAAMIRPALIGGSSGAALAPESAYRILENVVHGSGEGSVAAFSPQAASAPPLHLLSSTGVPGGLAVAATVIGVIFGVQAFIAANAAPALLAVQLPESYTNQAAEVRVRVSAPLSPVKRFYARAADGACYEGGETASGDYVVFLPQNGEYTLFAVSENHKSASQTVEINRIDSTYPVLEAVDESGAQLHLRLFDAESGVDVQKVTLSSEAGEPLAPVAIDEESGVFSFPLVEGRFTVTIADHAGNSVWYWLTVSPRGHTEISPAT